MALTETPPREAEAEVPPYDAPPAAVRGLAAVVGTSDHKVVGRLFMGTAFLFGLVAAGGGQLVAIDRIDGTTGNTILNNDTFFQVFTLQAVAGTLLFALPVLIGLGLLVVPLQIGAKTVAFPRAAAAAYWSFLVSGCLVVASYIMNGGPGGGSSTGVDLWALAMLGVVASLLLATLCVVTTVLGLRAPGMTLDRTPLFSWSMLAAGGVWLLSLPVLAASLLLVYTGHRFAGRSFTFSSNGALFTRIRWVLSQPQIYAFAAPVLGITADVVVTAVRRHTLHRAAMTAIGAFAVLGFGAYLATFDNPKVLSEPVFVVGAFGAVIPLLLFGGLMADTLRRGSVRLTSPLVFVAVAYLMLLVGVLAGAAGAVGAFDLRGTVWSTAVTNYVVLAAIIGALGGLHHWATKVAGRPLSEPVGYLAALALLGGTVLTCFPDLISGAFGNKADKVHGIEALNTIVAIGTAVVILGALLAVVNVLGGLRRRSGTDDNEGEPDPWAGGLTLEWATTSPPPRDNFDVVLPEVSSEAPLLDARRSDEAQSHVTEGANA